ncbi:MAG: fold metallo-hydrolase [Chloroflexi bacterium]|nr:fold metallo-hydrolase [Chloroflexota bacterium]
MIPPTDVRDIHCISVPTPYLVGPVNCYLLDGPSPVLVDCGPATDAAETALRAGLAAHGVRPADIETIVLTHHHADHAGGLGWLRRESAAQLVGHPFNDLWLRGNNDDLNRQSEFYAWLYRYCDTPVPPANYFLERASAAAAETGYSTLDRALVEGDSVELGTGLWRVFETPGHAGTSISLVRSDGVALVGDTLLQRISSNAFAEPPYPGETKRHRSLLAYRRTLSRLATLDVSLILPGHGPSFSDHTPLIARRLRNQEERSQRLLAGIDDGHVTVLALTYLLFPGLAENQLFLGLSEVIGHLDILEEAGLVRHDGEAPARYIRP